MSTATYAATALRHRRVAGGMELDMWPSQRETGSSGHGPCVVTHLEPAQHGEPMV